MLVKVHYLIIKANSVDFGIKQDTLSHLWLDHFASQGFLYGFNKR